MASGQTTRRFRHRNDFARVRDVYKHLIPWNDTFSPVALHRDAFAAHEQGPEPCPDTTLAALAQLCVLRMGGRTCLVTLACGRTEYVLADMTKTASFQQSVGNDAGAWVGTSNFNYSQGMTAQAFDEWCTARRIREEPSDELHYYTEGLSPHWFIVSDIRSNPPFQHLGFVQHGPWIRFYCSLPLRSAHGSVIGSLTILDDRPRYGVSSSEMALMEDLSDTIVQHLDATAVRSQRQRGERFLQSLALFNTGEHSMRTWWQSQDDSRVLNMGRYVAKGSAEERQSRLDAQFGVEEGLDHEDTLIRKTETTSRSNSLESSKNMSLTTRRRKKSRRCTEVGTEDSFDLGDSSAKAYNRASNLIREALGADGVVFVNASATTASMKREDSSGADSDAMPTASVTDAELSVDEAHPKGDAVQLSKLMSFSTRNKSSVLGHRNPPRLFRLSVPYLQRLIRRYPRGSVFHFDPHRDTFVPSTDDSSHSSADQEKRKNQQRKEDEKILGDVVKDANSVSFYPLMDDGNDRWRSCIFVWSMEKEKFFDKSEDLSYLRTFGHCLVAELSRLESMAADHAKGTFISSISHELRSPLHGILAATEFLDETELSAFQLEMAHAISIAGRTLLDTVNHILDHSKISSFMRSRKARKDGNSPMKYASLTGTSTYRDDGSGIDLALLTEEVVETCVTSHRSPTRPHGTSSTSYADLPEARRWDQSHNSNTSGDVISDVAITLNISERSNWKVEMQPGAWTRILTNLVGNAQKYTQTGHISVRLNVLDESAQSGTGESCRRPVELVIEDTGVGMSQQFLEQDVFTPFKQEDPHSTGTGLGLSIVKQIAKDLGAQLNISSKQNEGTRVSLRFKATFEDDKCSPTSSPSPNPPTQQGGRGKVNFFRLLSPPNVEKTGPEASLDHLDSIVSNSVVSNAREWLGCEISMAADTTKPHPAGTSVYAMTERNLTAWSYVDSEGLATMLKAAAVQHSRILILADTMQSVSLADSLRGSLPLESVLLHQPIGPRKLLRAVTWGHDVGTSGPFPEPFDGVARPLIHVKRSSPPSIAAVPAGSYGFTHSSQVPSTEISAGFQQTSLSPVLNSDLPSSTLPTSISIPQRISTATPTTSGDDTTASSSLSSRAQDPGRRADTVLLVEDNDLNMRILVALMNKLQRPYQCVTDGRAALSAYRQSPSSFFLVLMDMSMPVMDGFQATAKFRETEQKHKLKPVYICALTGVTSEDARARAFSCGVDEFFSKPVRIKELQTLLEKVKRESAGSAVGES